MPVPHALPVLDAEEQRVLGALLEKQVTVPASYPLTLGALRTACNQTSSREPVVDFDEQAVEAIVKRLRDLELVRVVWAATGRRTLKYHQLLTERLDLADDERSLLTVLLLRGPQPAGALRTQAERLHGFADRAAVEDCLAALAAREQPLVQELPRRPGQKDTRWVHRLGPVDADGAPAATTGAERGDVDRESVLADGPDARDARVVASYDAVATAYADHLADEWSGDLPLEKWLLTRVVGLAGEHPVVEAGCGPGHTTAYLAAAGADATGLDLSPAMIEQARERYPHVSYRVGDLRTLMRPPADDGWGAVVAWYSLIHLAASELPAAIAALVRPLRPGGHLLIGMHAGDRVRHVDSWFDREVSLDFVLHDPAEVAGLAEAAGLVDVEWYRRGARAFRSETNERLYVLGRRPS
jgi:uncharacterized protein YceH (UPF0502 family)/2-polyprenyl-3-methyl-5-hydroxy-6-metoxy-1,4-benzoquinol methylase